MTYQSCLEKLKKKDQDANVCELKILAKRSVQMLKAERVSIFTLKVEEEEETALKA